MYSQRFAVNTYYRRLRVCRPLQRIRWGRVGGHCAPRGLRCWARTAPAFGVRVAVPSRAAVGCRFGVRVAVPSRAVVGCRVCGVRVSDSSLRGRIDSVSREGWGTPRLGPGFGDKSATSQWSASEGLAGLTMYIHWSVR